MAGRRAARNRRGFSHATPGGGQPRLNDATGIIQSVNDYRQDAMDYSNDAWDAYIRE